MSKYYLLSVSTKQNLDLCRRYALGGVTNSATGVWAYSDVSEGDYVSLLYGAKAYDLYRVEEKFAILRAENVGPWPKITFQESGRSYYFPFRFKLHTIRTFGESLVRAEFAYVAENLLLRGGYRKTHFQADQTTLQNASQMGELYDGVQERFDSGKDLFEPTFTKRKATASPPQSFQFNELILQSVLKSYLSRYNNLSEFVIGSGVSFDPSTLEVLGEKALPEGHLDILVKESIPIGQSKKIVVEVKARTSSTRDLEQLLNYKQELGRECLAAILVGQRHSRQVVKRKDGGATLVEYFVDWNGLEEMAFSQLLSRFKIHFVKD